VHNDDKLTHTKFNVNRRPYVRVTHFVKVLHTYTVVNFVEIGRTWKYYIRKNVPSMKMVYYRGKIYFFDPK
jgi:hypothetical protein